MTNIEKIAEKKEKIKKSKEKILTEQAKITKLQKEIEELESLEVKGLLKEIDMPLDQLKEFIKELSNKNNTRGSEENGNNQ